MEKITLGIAEDQALFRKGMMAMLNAIPDFEVILEAENGMDLLEQVDQKKLSPSVFLLDLSMPEMDGIETTEVLKSRNSANKIVIVSAFDDLDIISHLYQKGANAFIDKNAEPEEVEYAIKSVHKNDFYINQAARQAIDEEKETKDYRKETTHLSALSNREKEIIRLICMEYTNVEMAERLHLSKRTVDNYRLNILNKTQSKNTAGVVLFAVQNGLIDWATLKIRY
jgi:DNA-binding NarL/FixJ family response regulator